MALTANEAWDLDTDEILSLDSEDLHERRPNRWRGAPSTWRTLTDEDRSIYYALEGVKNRDLAAHLYNAFALKRKAARLRELADPDQDIKDQTGEHVPPSDWQPRRGWTAWPQRARHAPRDDFMPRVPDGNEKFTVRSSEPVFPSSALEEELSATTLRFAKEKLWKVQEKHAVEPEVIEETGTSVGDESDEEEKDGSNESDSAPNLDQNQGRPAKRQRLKHKVVPSTEDAYCYRLLRPFSRRIISKLDDTLRVLHNARMSSLNHRVREQGTMSLPIDDMMAREQDEDSAPQELSEPQLAKLRAKLLDKAVGPQGGRKMTIRYAQREDETETEFLLRVARSRKKSIPDELRVFAKKFYKARAAKRVKFEGGKAESVKCEDEEQDRVSRSGSREQSTVGKSRSRSVASETSIASGSISNASASRLRSWTQWDWRQVLGAGALADFPPAVLARATQRCANLFGQDMVMHSIPEQPVSGGREGIRTTRYVSGQLVPDGEGDGEDRKSAAINLQSQVLRRRTNLAPLESDEDSFLTEAESEQDSSGINEEAFEATPRRATPPPRNPLCCPKPDCLRAERPFAKSSNLARHIRDEHEEEGVAADREKSCMEDEDALLGGVHVDGFLRPIQIKLPSQLWYGSVAGCRRAEEPFMRQDDSASHGQAVYRVDEGEEKGEESKDDDRENGKDGEKSKGEAFKSVTVLPEYRPVIAPPVAPRKKGFPGRSAKAQHGLVEKRNEQGMYTCKCGKVMGELTTSREKARVLMKEHRAKF